MAAAPGPPVTCHFSRPGVAPCTSTPVVSVNQRATISIWDRFTPRSGVKARRLVIGHDLFFPSVLIRRAGITEKCAQPFSGLG
jgi:hypothetical protein